MRNVLTSLLPFGDRSCIQGAGSSRGKSEHKEDCYLMQPDQKLDAYRQSLEFVDWALPLTVEVREKSGRPATQVCDHLDYASLSILFNTTEGKNQSQQQIRAMFLEAACSAATECGVCLDALVNKEVCDKPRIQPGKDLLLRVMSTLNTLAASDPLDDIQEELLDDWEADESV